MKKNNILEDGARPRARRVKLPVDTLEKFFIQSLSSSVFRAAKLHSRQCWSDSVDCSGERDSDKINAKPRGPMLSDRQEMPKPRCAGALCRLRRARAATESRQKFRRLLRVAHSASDG